MTGLLCNVPSVYAVVSQTMSAHGSQGYAVTEIVSINVRSTDNSSKMTSIFSA